MHILRNIFLIYFLTTAWAWADCPTGYTNNTLAVFAPYNVMPYRDTGTCGADFERFTLYDLFIPNVNTLTHCGPGYYKSGDTCVAMAQNNCPENYYAPIPTQSFQRVPDNTECATNYLALDPSPDLCLQYLGNNMAEICTPQIICDAGGTTLRTSTGIILPMYAERATNPSLNFGFTNGKVCYINLLSGSADNAINIKINNTTYHGVN